MADAGTTTGRMTGRTAVVTGAAGGLGEIFCEALGREGATVVGVDVADQAVTQRRVESLGASYVGIDADLTDEADCARVAREVADRCDGADILVNNAGIFPVIGFLETTRVDWQRIHGLNVEGTFAITRALLPQMLERGWGRVVMISSGAIWLGPPGMVAYTASKSALIGMTRALASEFGASGVTFNAITPGLTRTNTALTSEVRHQFEHVVAGQAVPRAEEPEDLVTALLFVCDEGSGFMTGQAINVDGGIAKH